MRSFVCRNFRITSSRTLKTRQSAISSDSIFFQTAGCSFIFIFIFTGVCVSIIKVLRGNNDVKITSRYFRVINCRVYRIGANCSRANARAATLDSIIGKADIQAQMYRETFKDLIADEKKTFVEFDKNGAEKKSTSVESDYLVYQSAKSGGDIGELRNILRVDGKTVPDAQVRAERLQAELQKTDTAAAELEKIADESLRYDKTLEIDGLTLYEGIVLTDYLRPNFEFQMLGTENLDDNEVYVIGFRQTKPSPYITFSGKSGSTDKVGLDFSLDLPGKLKKENVFLRGKFYIDAKTFQIRREVREVIAGNASALTTTFDYTTSDYNILVAEENRFDILQIEEKLRQSIRRG